MLPPGIFPSGSRPRDLIVPTPLIRRGSPHPPLLSYLRWLIDVLRITFSSASDRRSQRRADAGGSLPAPKPPNQIVATDGPRVYEAPPQHAPHSDIVSKSLATGLSSIAAKGRLER